MKMTPERFGQFVYPLLIVMGAFIAGIVFERIVLIWLKKTAEKTKWRGDEIVISSLKGVTIIFFLVAGVYVATLAFPFPSAILEITRKLLVVIVVLSMTIVMARIFTGLFNIYGEGEAGVLPSTSIFSHLTKIIVFILGILILLQTFGISVTPILTALGIGGLAVALALQDTLSNLFSGLQIIASGQIKIGDYVRLDSGEEGHVTDITWRNTTIKTLPYNLVIVPNSKIASAIVTNFCLPEQTVKVYVDVGVSYDSDLEKVERVTVEVAKETMREVRGGLPDSEPSVMCKGFGDFGIDLTVIMHAKEFMNQYLIKHEFIKRLHRRYIEEGIKIPLPMGAIRMKRGDE